MKKTYQLSVKLTYLYAELKTLCCVCGVSISFNVNCSDIKLEGQSSGPRYACDNHVIIMV